MKKNINEKEIILQEREKMITYYEKYQNFLTQAQRQAFHLRYYEDLSFQEISDILATTRAGAYDNVKKAKVKLESIAKKMQISNG